MSQSLSSILTHIIFLTKDRHPFLKNPVVLQKVHQYILALYHHQHCVPIAIGGAEDHVHILINLHKNQALSNLIEKIKKSSSKWIKNLCDLDNDLVYFYWQRGYGAFSVSQSNLENVKKYIHNQREHHKNGIIKKNYENF